MLDIQYSDDYIKTVTLKNDKRLKKPRVEMEYTLEMAMEVQKCMEDVYYFGENYFEIVTLDADEHGNRRQMIKARDYQRRIIDSVIDERFTIVLSPRQIGKCFCGNSRVKLRNKKTGKVEEIPVETFYNCVNKTKSNIEWDDKFIESFEIDDYEIMTDTGWEEISHIHKTIEFQVYEIITDNFSLRCADDHIVFTEDFREIYTKDLKVGDLIATENGFEVVRDLKIHDEYEHMYDITVNSDNHRFYSDGILSHNTTILRWIALWYACFEKDFEIVIASNKESTSIKTLRKIKDAFLKLPLWLKPGVEKWDEKCVIFDNGSKIHASATTEDGCRGDSVNLLILDEFAHIRNKLADEFYTSIFPTISEGKTSKIVMISTPNGVSGPYYETWAKASRNLNRFNAVEIHWHEPPNRDKKWLENIRADIGDRRCRQEYLNKFIGSSDTLISAEFLETLFWEEDFIECDEGKAKKYEEPKKGHIYVAGVDVAEGCEKDSSVINIYDITDINNIREVFLWRSNTVNTELFSEYVMNWVSYYNNAWVMLESNSIGESVANDLWYDYEYEYLCNYSNKKLGIKSNRSVKVKACLNMKNKLEKGALLVRSKEVISELSTFVDYGNQRYKAEEGNNDDCVMAFVWAVFCTHRDVMEELDIEADHEDSEEAEDDFGGVEDDALGIFSSADMITAEEEAGYISTAKFSDIFGR